MEMLGGLLVGTVIAYLALSICAGGLCAKDQPVKDAYKEARG